jgi:hypothetical protein
MRVSNYQCLIDSSAIVRGETYFEGSYIMALSLILRSCSRFKRFCLFFMLWKLSQAAVVFCVTSLAYLVGNVPRYMNYQKQASTLPSFVDSRTYLTYMYVPTQVAEYHVVWYAFRLEN